MTARNTLNKQQTKALAALWTKWRVNTNTIATNPKLHRLAYSPYYSGIGYIVIERRDDDQTLDKWDWGLTYYSDDDSRRDGDSRSLLYWTSNQFPETMPTEIRDFLREAWDKEFASIHQTNL